MNNLIGIDKEKAQKLAGELNELLANYEVYYQNLRAFHWNIRGPEFFELHAKFEELYVAAQTAIDEVAERILTLGETPVHTFTDFLAGSRIVEQRGLTDGKQMVQKTLENLQVLITKERVILELAGDAADEGTVALMSDYITVQEKVVWMLAAWLDK